MAKFAPFQLVRNIGRSTFQTSPTKSISTVAAASPIFEETAAQGTSRRGRDHFQLLTKSKIRSLFSHYAPKLDPVAYIAAAHVFPMRVNNFVVEELIDWFVLSDVSADLRISRSPFFSPIARPLSLRELSSPRSGD